MTVYKNYFYSEHDFDKEHMGYKPLSIPEGEKLLLYRFRQS